MLLHDMIPDNVLLYVLESVVKQSNQKAEQDVPPKSDRAGG